MDEVDSILVDEARTPLIISGPSEESTDKYYKIDRIIPKLVRDADYSLDEKHRTASLTEDGVAKCFSSRPNATRSGWAASTNFWG